MRPVSPSLRLLVGPALPLAAAALLCGGGCSIGSTHIVELDFKRIDQSDQLIENVDYDQGYWWAQDDQIQVALARVRHSANPLSRERVHVSFVLDGLPAEKGRDYPLDTRSLRAYVRKGIAHTRYVSVRGVIRLRYGPSNSVTGRFRLLSRRQVFHALTGWSNAGQTVWVGEFTASRNERQGRVILSETEEDGMERTASENTPREAGRPVRVEGPPVMRPVHTPR